MAYQKLGRDTSARKALFRDMVTDLFIYERIETTEAKAKEVRSIAEKLITSANRRFLPFSISSIELNGLLPSPTSTSVPIRIRTIL